MKKYATALVANDLSGCQGRLGPRRRLGCVAFVASPLGTRSHGMRGRMRNIWCWSGWPTWELEPRESVGHRSTKAQNGENRCWEEMRSRVGDPGRGLPYPVGRRGRVAMYHGRVVSLVGMWMEGTLEVVSSPKGVNPGRNTDDHAGVPNEGHFWTDGVGVAELLDGRTSQARIGSLMGSLPGVVLLWGVSREPKMFRMGSGSRRFEVFSTSTNR